MKLDLGRTKVSIVPYTLRDHIAILASRINSDSDLMKKAYSDVLAKCVDQKMNKHESELALIHLIAKSDHQDEVYQDFTCDCGYTQKAKIDIDKTYIDVDESSIETPYAFENYKVKFKWPKLWADDNVGSMVAESIEAIYIGNDRITVEDLTDLELDDLYDAFTEDHINSITKILLAPKVVLVQQVKCEKCGKAHVNVIKGLKEFIDIL
ncbi:baseplate hub [Acinetobacter phage Acj9]|uniref:Gp26 baseplate hub subunit n=1 Tax=Acinetobacter phage Acj9 TaxID=760939 RepID=E5EPY1_9CAUD|nr:baseplate hub [Acinetobacter phage Acj9]ADG60097.1 gp26 baseplate hub subunit [Acinetobacter phage Acj9]